MMFEHKKIAADFGKSAGCYSDYAKLQAEIGSQLIEDAAPFITKNSLIIDVGSGSGHVSRKWQENILGIDIISLDIAFAMCREAARNGLKLINAAAESLPLKSNSFDAIVSNLMLQWINQQEDFFAESFRVLKSGGIIAISSFTEGTLAELKQAFEKLGEHRRASDFPKAEIIVQKLRNCGFEILASKMVMNQKNYQDIFALFKEIKAIGASNKRIDRPRGLLTPRLLNKLKQSYNENDNKSITASWETQIIVARKIVVRG